MVFTVPYSLQLKRETKSKHMSELNELASAEGRKTILCFSVTQSCDISISFLSVNITHLTHFRTLSKYLWSKLLFNTFLSKSFGDFFACWIFAMENFELFLNFIKLYTTSSFFYHQLLCNTFFFDNGTKFQRGTKKMFSLFFLSRFFFLPPGVVP